MKQPVPLSAVRRTSLLLAMACALLVVPARAENAGDDTTDPQVHPLLRAPKDRSPGERVLRAPVALIELPFRILGAGLEQTLNVVEHGDLFGAAKEVPPWLAERHIYLGNGGQGAGSGIGVAAGVFARPRNGLVTATTAWTVREYQSHGVEIHQPLGHAARANAWGRYSVRAADHFFGVGPDSRVEDESFYSQDDVTAGFSLSLHSERATVTFLGEWTDRHTIEDGPDEDEPTIDVFPGLAGENGFTLASAGARYTSPQRLYRGGREPETGVEAEVRTWWDTDGARFGFTRYSLTVHQASPLFWHDRILAARLQVSMTEPYAGREVPFQMLNSLGGARGLRAFDVQRFRDLDVALLNVEYRFPAWNIGVPGRTAMDAVVFADVGLISAELEDNLNRNDLETDAGFGFRLRVERATLLRLQLAFGEEEGRAEIKFGRDY